MASPLKKLHISFFVCLLLFQIQTTMAQEYGTHRRSSWLPQDAVVQYAGSIGFLSVGVGYGFGKGKFDADILLGYLPKQIGGDHIWTAALKANWLPFQLNLDDNFSLIPLTSGLMISHTFGNKYFVLLPDRYPPNYYKFSTAVHLYYQLGSRVQFQLWEDKIPEMAFFYELNSSMESTISYIQNPQALSLSDIFNLSLGLRIMLN